MIARVKICCMKSIQEARLAIRYGASAVGLVTEMPSGPAVISQDEIAMITSTIPPLVGSFLLTSANDPAVIIEQQKFCKTNTIQICCPLDISAYDVLRSQLPGISLVQVVHVTGPSAVDDVRRVAPYADAILVDSGNPDSAQPKFGGTGQTHDWSISRRIRDMIDMPLILAGGLTHQNVAEAITSVQPYAVDVCTGVRVNGKLNEEKLSLFFKSVGSVDTGLVD
jgi:phosphoribosylanthranilate isomerase